MSSRPEQVLIHTNHEAAAATAAASFAEESEEERCANEQQHMDEQQHTKTPTRPNNNNSTPVIAYSTSVGARIEGHQQQQHMHNMLLIDNDLMPSPAQMRSISAMDMEELSCLLREQDADLLELHQSQTPNDETPQLTAAKRKTINANGGAVGAVPELLLPPASISTDGTTEGGGGGSNNHSGRHLQRQRLSFETTTGATLTTTTTSIAGESPSSPPPVPRPIRRRASRSRSNVSDAPSSNASLPPGGESASESRPTLGGQIYQQESFEVIELPAAEVEKERSLASKKGTLLQREPATFQNQKGGDEILTLGIRRSESIDRRLCEAAQFAQAVGDAKVADDLLILEEDRSDDDDESSEECQDDDDDDNVLDELLMAEQEEELEVKTAASTAPGDGDQTIHSHDASEIAVVVQPVSSSSVVEVLPPEQDDLLASSESVHSIVIPPAVNKKETSSSPSPYPKGRGGLRPAPFLQGHHKKRFTTKRGFLDQLPAGETSCQTDYVYKGLRANPPEIVKRGIQRGNYAQLHRKAWLEVSDKYHRYGKNLRFYYRHWETLGCPTNMFFDWLDSKGEAAGLPLPEIEECPRAQLDADTVLYISDPDVTEHYALALIPDENGRGRVVDIDGDPVGTGPDGWIFVLRDNRMYGAQKITSVTGRSKQRFHHSSFFGGKAVAAAGIFITDEEGFLVRLYPHSGHYRPREAHMQRVLFFLHHEGVDLRSFDMDMQQILHVAREKDGPKTNGNRNNHFHKGENNHKGGNHNNHHHKGENNNNCGSSNHNKPEKKKKVESLCLVPAVIAACFLAHKARFVGASIFEQIHQIRKANVVSVTEALDLVDDGGYW